MKKIISLLLFIIMILSLFSVSVSAVSLSEGSRAIQNSFKAGMAALDYVYFSPVKSNKDKTKYPLVLWLHGNSSGNYPGHQLENSDIYKFASDEFQARFKNAGGAFLLLPRDSTTDISLAWDGVPIDKAKATLDSFIAEFGDNIDTSRIYVGGNSMGGNGAYRMVVSFPGLFAAAFPMSPVSTLGSLDFKAMKDTAVWIFSSNIDRYPQLTNLIVTGYFNSINSFSANPERNRWTSFDALCYSDGRKMEGDVHNTWNAALNDMFMDNRAEYLYSTTVNGKGEKITLTYPDGLISWLSEQSLDESVSIGSNRNFFTKIIDFFISIFNAIISIFGL